MSDAVVEASKNPAEGNHKKSDVFSLLALLKVSSVLAFLTTYSHFFGYSFLKGKLEAMGFYAADVNPSINETLFLASEGLAQGINSIWADSLRDDYRIFISLVTGAVIFAVAWYALNEGRIHHWLRNKFKPRKNGDAQKKAKLVVLASATVFGFLLQALAGFAFLMLLSFLWYGTSLGYKLGEQHIAAMIEKGVCKPVDWHKTRADFAVSCLSVKDGEHTVKGRPIYQNQERLYFLTGKAAYWLDADGKTVVQRLEVVRRPG